MPIRAGVLSDTHLTQPDTRFMHHIRQCFHTCEVIIHAGDAVDPSVLEAFRDKTVYAVCGNMCNQAMASQYPKTLRFRLGRFVIGLAHGARMGPDIENSLWNLFPEADCIIYGHTHQAVCRRHGQTLFVNPGNFNTSNPYGAQGTYAILEAGATLDAKIFHLPQGL